MRTIWQRRDLTTDQELHQNTIALRKCFEDVRAILEKSLITFDSERDGNGKLVQGSRGQLSQNIADKFYRTLNMYQQLFDRFPLASFDALSFHLEYEFATLTTRADMQPINESDIVDRLYKGKEYFELKKFRGDPTERFLSLWSGWSQMPVEYIKLIVKKETAVKLQRLLQPEQPVDKTFLRKAYEKVKKSKKTKADNDNEWGRIALNYMIAVS